MAYRFRQYGLWERYVDLYRNDDLEYTVGDSYHEKDWFFAHVTRCLFHPYRPGDYLVIFHFPGPYILSNDELQGCGKQDIQTNHMADYI